MKKIILIVLMITPFYMLAQMNSVVNLKNGSAVRGEVLQNDSTGVRLRTRDGSYWKFSADEVLSVEKFKTEIKETGYYNRVSLGVLSGNDIGGSFRVVNGFSLNRHWDFGFGLGIESLRWDPYIPVFLESRYSILEGNTRPFISVSAGYEMPMQNFEFNKGGFSGGIDLGVTHYVSRHVGVSTSLGYRYAWLKENSSWWDDFTTISQINRLEIRFGLVFR